LCAAGVQQGNRIDFLALNGLKITVLGASAKKIHKFPLAILKHADYNMNISGIENHIKEK
jgi:hypothetical protein